MGVKSSASKSNPHMDAASMSAAAQAAQLMFKKAELQHQQQLQSQQPIQIRTTQKKNITRSLSHNSIASSSISPNYAKSPTLSVESSNAVKRSSITKSNSARVSLHSHLSNPSTVSKGTNGGAHRRSQSIASTGREPTGSIASPPLMASSSGSKKKKTSVKQTWNQVNASSSQAALAAASLIAKQNPSKMGPKESFNKEVLPKANPVPQSALTVQLNFKTPAFKDSSTSSNNETKVINDRTPIHSPRMVPLHTTSQPSNSIINNNNNNNSDTASSNISHLGISPLKNLSSTSVHSAASHNSQNGIPMNMSRYGSAALSSNYIGSRTNSTASISEEEEFMPLPLDISSSSDHNHVNLQANNHKIGNNPSSTKFNYEIPNLKDLQNPTGAPDSRHDFPYPPSSHPYYSLYKRPSTSTTSSIKTNNKLTVPAISVDAGSINESVDDINHTLGDLHFGLSTSGHSAKASPKLLAAIPGSQVPLSKRHPPPPDIDSSPEMMLSAKFNGSDISLDSHDENHSKLFGTNAEILSDYGEGVVPDYGNTTSSVTSNTHTDYEDYFSRANTLHNSMYKVTNRPGNNVSDWSSTSSVNRMPITDIAGNAAILASKQQQYRKQQEQIQLQQQQQEQQQLLQKQRPSFISIPSSTTLNTNVQSDDSGPSTPYYPLSRSDDVKLPHHHHGPLRGKHSKQIKKIFGMKNDSTSSMKDHSHDYFTNPNTSSPSYHNTTPSAPVSGSNSLGVSLMVSNGYIANNSTNVSLSIPQPLQPQPSSQKLKFKTTMRKEKYTKSQFNESKPWKHHTASDTVTEEERKRYEGVWASNKGSNIDKDIYLMEGFDHYAVVVNEDGTLVEVDDEDDYDEDDEFDDDDDDDEDDDDDDGDDEDEEGEEDEYEDPDEYEEYRNKIKRTSTTVATSTEKGVRFELLDLDLKQCVHGLVVRELWRRSRLSDDTLERIWDLLINRRSDEFKARNPQMGDNIEDIEFDFGILSKKEFILGMWLVDQCLYGKKLPKSITSDLWDSVEEKAGIKVQNIKPKKKGKRRKKMLRKVVGRGSSKSKT